MTTRDFFTAVIENDITDDVKQYAASALAKLDKPTEKQVENAALKKEIFELLSSEPLTAIEVASRMDISTQKASALLLQLAKENSCIMTVRDVKVGGKDRLYKGYFIGEDD